MNRTTTHTIDSPVRFKISMAIAIVLALLASLATAGSATATPPRDELLASATASVSTSKPVLERVVNLPNKMISGKCAGGRCTVYFNKSETAAIGRGSIPPAPTWLPIPLRAVYIITAQVHRWIAADYARRGMCSGFQLSAFPWETQGYFGYRC